VKKQTRGQTRFQKLTRGQTRFQKNRSQKRTAAACVLACVLAVLMPTFSGCGGGADPLPSGGGNGSGTVSEAPAVTPAPGTEERTMKELLTVSGMTLLTADTRVYDATALGVPADGKADCADAIHAAVDAVLEKGGGILYFPSGRYRIISPLLLDHTRPGWICLAGDPDGSSRFAISSKLGDRPAVSVARDDTHFSFLSFEDSNAQAPSVSLEARGASLYGVTFKKSTAKSTVPCLEVSGSYNTVRQCGFSHANFDAYQVEFTKYPGRDARGNVMCDVHFGDRYTKCTLVSSRDESGAQEALTIARNLYLIPGEPMIEVRAVNGLAICNNMLDAASTAVEIAPEGFGVYNVEIRDNYMGGSKGGVRMVKSDAPGGNIFVHDNYIWAPDSVTVWGENYSRVSVAHNYSVLTGGQALFMLRGVAAKVGGNLVANISGGGATELEIITLDKASEIDPAGYGSVDVPKDGARIDAEVPELPPVPANKPYRGAERPGITGDTPLGTLLTHYYNVKDYGAAGDGVTDDTAAVEKCVKDAKKSSGTAYFPAGTYLITKTIKVTKDDSKILTIKGDGADVSRFIGAESLDGPIFDIRMKYNFNAKDLGFEHRGQGSGIDALYVKAFDCAFTSGEGNTAPLLHFSGSNCWAVRCEFNTRNAESYGLTYTRDKGEISINDFITDNIFTGPGKGVLVGDGSTVGEGRSEGLKIHGNTFVNTGKTSVEIYEILHVNIAYNTFDGAENAIFLSNRGYGPDGIYIDHNKISARGDCITSGTVDGGGDYISMVVIHDNLLTSDGGKPVSEPVAFASEMIH
jgi:hypothetical protein